MRSVGGHHRQLDDVGHVAWAYHVNPAGLGESAEVEGVGELSEGNDEVVASTLPVLHILCDSRVDELPLYMREDKGR